jgi:hypothetical protein
MILVPGAVLTKVLETRPYVLVVPRGTGSAANAGEAPQRNARNPRLAKRLKPIIRLRIFFVLNILDSSFYFLVK